MLVKTLLCALSFVVVNSKEVTFLSKCKLDDSVCLKKTAQHFVPTFVAGIPEIGLEVLDPLHIDKVDSSNSALKFVTRNMTFTGLRNTKIEDIKVNKDITTIFLRLTIGLVFTSDYEISGKLLILPIEGKGPMTIHLPRVEVTIACRVLRKTENGRTYFMVTYKEHTFTVKTKSDVKLGNLFNGNEALAAAAEEMMSQNGNEIIRTIGDPIIKSVTDAIIVRINKLLKAFEADEIYIH